MTKEQFVKIFLEEGVDEEWAMTIWARFQKSSYALDWLTETWVRAVAKEWKKAIDEGHYGH